MDKVGSAVSQQAVAASELIKALQSDDEQLNHDMVEGETSFFEAVEAALDEIDECEVLIEGVGQVMKRLSDREARMKKRRDKLRGLIDQAFQIAEIKSHKFPTATITVKSVKPHAIVSDEAEIPSRFFKPQPPKLDKTALLEALKAENIPGASLSNGGSTIQIRRA